MEEPQKMVDESMDWGEGYDEEDLPLMDEICDGQGMDEKNVEAVPDREVKSDEHDLDRKCEECRESFPAAHVTLVFPMPSRQQAEVIHALNSLVTRFRYLGVYVDRLPSDKARELFFFIAMGHQQHPVGGAKKRGQFAKVRTILFCFVPPQKVFVKYISPRLPLGSNGR